MYLLDVSVLFLPAYLRVWMGGGGVLVFTIH